MIDFPDFIISNRLDIIKINSYLNNNPNDNKYKQ